MLNFQKFSLYQALHYAFTTYVKNFKFFFKIFTISLIGSLAIYWGKLFLPSIFSGELGLILPIALLCWDIILNVLLLKSYGDTRLLRFEDFFQYDFNLGYYLLYSVFIYCIESISGMMSGYSATVASLATLIGFALSVLLALEYFLGKYLILDKNLTFIQSLRAVPYLVRGEKLKLACSWLVSSIAVIPAVLLSFLSSYLMFGSIEKNYLELITIPFSIAYGYPIVNMVFISIYKQLVANADEQFNEGLASFEALNQAEDNALEDDENV